jgi:two-component system chemotaxis response regulator CheB
MHSVPRTRILIVDDSIVMRSVLRSVVAADARLEVAGTAANGAAALSTLETLRPNLILLDVEMPVMDGLATLRELRTLGHNMPVIMCSALTRRGARVTIEALAGGASDYVSKPAGQSSREAAIRALAQDLIPRIHALTRQPALRPAPHLPLIPPLAPPLMACPPLSTPAALVIGVSTGGPAALDVLLPALSLCRSWWCSTCPRSSPVCLPSGSMAAARCASARPPRAMRCAPEPSISRAATGT